jgi:hypothetical protein
MTALVLYVSLAATMLWCVGVWMAIGWGTCGGSDGGEPYARPGSLAQRFCDEHLSDLWPVLVALAAVGIAAHLIGLGRLQAGRPCRSAIPWLVVAYLALVPYSVPAFLPTS